MKIVVMSGLSCCCILSKFIWKKSMSEKSPEFLSIIKKKYNFLGLQHYLKQPSLENTDKAYSGTMCNTRTESLLMMPGDRFKAHSSYC